MDTGSRLRKRPEIQIAVGQLPSHERSHVRICLRVMGSRLSAVCSASDAAEAEITLRPAPGNPARVEASSCGRQVELELPLRMQPLADAINELIDSQVTDPDPMQDVSAAQGTSVALPAPTVRVLSRLPQRSATWLSIEGGAELLVDAEHHNAWLAPENGRFPATLGSDIVTGMRPATGDEADPGRLWAAGMRPILVEQLYWMAPEADGTLPLDHWLKDPSLRIRLTSWPNLSLQPDAQQWLQVLPALWEGSLEISELLRRLQSAGIAPRRARAGVALLGMFRHAWRSPARIEPQAPSPAALPPAQSAPRGLLARLKHHLRRHLS
ncbi:MAG: hypothetical protein Q4F49_03605 [Pseudoxanthomonas suwonensis]|nr:hypothetical protein [Pseudoxanthomonas suwonensis]